MVSRSMTSLEISAKAQEEQAQAPPLSARCPAPIRVMHLISGTGVGGAEMMLFKLLSALDRSCFTSIVYSMTQLGPTADRIRDLGIEVRTLGMKPRRPDPRAMLLLAGAVRRWRPHLIQTWMYHADLLGGLVGKIMDIPVVWNIRHSNLDPDANHWMTIRVAQICALLSAWIRARIVCCAESSRRIHAGLGYRAPKMVVIPNGFDLDMYRPHSHASDICHERFGIPRENKLISLIARYHPQKDHATFIDAARRCAVQLPETLYALCGEGMTAANDELMDLIRGAGLKDRIFLLGRCASEDLAVIISRFPLWPAVLRRERLSPMWLGRAMHVARSASSPTLATPRKLLAIRIRRAGPVAR